MREYSNREINHFFLNSSCLLEIIAFCKFRNPRARVTTQLADFTQGFRLGTILETTRLRQNCFPQRCCLIQFLYLDNHIPKWFELLPTARVEKMFQLVFQAAMKQATSRYCAPTIEIPVSTVISLLQLRRSHADRLKDNLARIITILVVCQ